MKLIFVRHCEPDYEHDSLTEKGFREAELLSQRVKNWDVTDFYVSPLGRAQATANASLTKMNRTAETLPWLREFEGRIYDPYLKLENRISWDYMPAYWTQIPEFYDKDAFAEAGCNAGTNVKEQYDWVCEGIDELLAKYGYIHEDGYFKTGADTKRDVTVVCFCHMGVILHIMSHLMGVSPVVMTSGFFLAPSSVTVLGTEEREDGAAFFRCQTAGDCKHLLDAGEPVSIYGYFTEPFQG